jgi:hypothetical protein
MVIASFLAVGAGYLDAFLDGAPHAWAPWCLALGTTGALMSLMALGALRGGRIAPALQWTFIGMFVLCSAAFGAALLLPEAEGVGGPLLLGLPLRSAIVIYVVGLAPLLVLPFVWARTFETSTLNEQDLRRLRETREAMTREPPKEGPLPPDAG